MKKYYLVSLCKNGILGGSIVADEEAITYKTGKITIPKEYKNLKMRYKDIVSMTIGKILFLPTVSLKMSCGKEYRFVVFARKHLVDLLYGKGIREVGRKMI